MLIWSVGGLGYAAAWNRVLAQLDPAEQRLHECYPDHEMSDADSYTAQHLECLEAELQQQIPISFETVSGKEALEALAAREGDGRSHFIIGAIQEAFNLFETFKFNSASPGELLAKAAKLNGQEWLRTEFQRGVRYSLEQLPPDYEVTVGGMTLQVNEMTASDWDNLKEVPLSAIAIGDWPETIEPNNMITATRDFRTGKAKPEVVIASLDTDNQTAIPAYLKYGNWNACPPAEVHSAVWRYWQKQYGIELVSARHDTLEFSVARPPGDRQQALDLAREQYAYCSDIVDQGVGTLASLAALLMESRYWFFWWD